MVKRGNGGAFRTRRAQPSATKGCMKTIVVDKYRGKVLQSISYEDGLVVINRKRTPEFLLWVILFPIVLLMMVMAFCVIICSIQDSIFGDYPIFEKSMFFLMGVFFLLCTTPLFIACAVFNSRIFKFQVSLKRDHGKLIYHLKNGFISHKKNLQPHHSVEITINRSRHGEDCRAYVGGNKIDSFLFLPTMPLIAFWYPFSIRRKAVVLEKIVTSCLGMNCHIKGLRP